MNLDPELLTGDTEVQAHIRARALEYVDRVFDIAQDDLEHGDAQTKAYAYKNVLPHMLSLARATEEERSSEAKVARDEAMRLLDEYRGTLPS